MQHSKVEANDDGKIGCAREILAYESLNNDILDDFQQIKMFLRKKRKYGILKYAPNIPFLMRAVLEKF